MVIETDLPHRQHLFGPAELGETCEMFLFSQCRFVGMDAYGRMNPVVFGGKREGSLQVMRARAAPDGQQMSNACLPGALDDIFPLVFKLGEFQMSVGIGKHGRPYVNFEPFGTS